MMDGGVRSGEDIARALALGADMVLLGRPFLYGVGALGGEGGAAVVDLLAEELRRVIPVVERHVPFGSWKQAICFRYVFPFTVVTS